MDVRLMMWRKQKWRQEVSRLGRLAECRWHTSCGQTFSLYSVLDCIAPHPCSRVDAARQHVTLVREPRRNLSTARFRSEGCAGGPHSTLSSREVLHSDGLPLSKLPICLVASSRHIANVGVEAEPPDRRNLFPLFHNKRASDANPPVFPCLSFTEFTDM